MSEIQGNTEQKLSDTAVPDLRDKVLAAIKTVYDPEIPVDELVDFLLSIINCKRSPRGSLYTILVQ